MGIFYGNKLFRILKKKNLLSLKFSIFIQFLLRLRSGKIAKKKSAKVM